MKKRKNENALVKEALRVVMERGIVEFEPTDSADLKVEYVYRLLIHDKKIIPLPNNQVSLPNKKKRLASWIAGQLPKDHPLLK